MNPNERATPRGGIRFYLLLGTAAAVLVGATAGAFFLPAPWSWTIGFVYIAYDTWLLTHMVRASRNAVRGDSYAASRSRERQNPVRVAVIVAARNERAVLPQTLEALFAQTDRADRVVVVDDGSTDGSVAWISERFSVELDGGIGTSRVEPSLAVVAKPHSGKADSLNRVIRLLDEDVVLTIDADTTLERDAVAAMRDAFAAEPELVAACGVLRPVCAAGRSGPAFQLFQTFEYLRAFLWRLAWMREQTLVLVSGAFAAFRREALVAVGGFDPQSRVEDYEVMFRLHRASLENGRPLCVRVVGGARAETDAPGTVRAFLRQRTRWFAGFLETMVRNRDLVWSARYRRFGRFHLPVKTLDMLLPIYGLAATLTLVAFLACGIGIDRRILAVVVAKLLFDISCYTICIGLYERWQGRRPTAGLYGRALAATLCEPLCFQLLRQAGAALGWVAFLRGSIEWAPRARHIASDSRPSARLTTASTANEIESSTTDSASATPKSSSKPM